MKRNAEDVSTRLVGYAARSTAVAGVFVLVAFLWTLVLQHILAYPFLFLFLGAVIGSAWFGGTLAGILSVILSSAVVDYFFIPPLYSFYLGHEALNYFIAFALCAVVISLVSASRKNSENAVREARDSLEERVLERTAQLQRSMQEIQESERRLRTLTEAIPQQIWSSDSSGLIAHCNQHLLDYTGCSAEQLGDEGFIRIFHPEDQTSFSEAWETCLTTEGKLEGEWRVRGKDGVYRWFLVRAVPQTDEDGKIERWYGTHIDTEERRAAERALAHAQTELSDLAHRLSLGEFAASIAHELNQPLTALSTNAYACREWLSSNPPNLQRALLNSEKLVQESRRASDVVARVRALFRKEIESRQFVDVNQLIRELLRLVHDDAISRGVSVRVELDPMLPRITADPVQIQQVLMNFATNGMDAMSSPELGKTLMICSSRKGSKEIEVQVKDEGVGISPEVLPRIFEPFFTTKRDGIGMGLAISRTIIEAHDGRLWATPEASGGTCFHFTMPVRP